VPFPSVVRERPLARLHVSLAALFALAVAPRAWALGPPEVHATATAGHALSTPQERELGWGGGGGLAVEVPIVSRWLGVQVAGDVLGLSAGAAPKDPSLAPRSAGALWTGSAGLRGHVFGFWLDAGGGFAASGSEVRPAFTAHAGYDVRLGRKSWWSVGPFAGWVFVPQPKDALRPEDGHFGVFGLQVTFSKPPERPPPTVVEQLVAKRTPPPARGDRDGDGVFDDEDACAAVPGVRTDERETNGCPPDLDRDGIVDVEDACVDVPGRRTGDPITNGCPDSNIQLADGALVVPERIHFDFDSPDVRADSVPVVQKIADYINRRGDVIGLEIEGHADERGTVAYNQTLSRARAESVKRLLEEHGVRCPIVVRAFGKLRPRAAGHAQDDHQENRRVEFLVKTSDQGEVPHASN